MPWEPGNPVTHKCGCVVTTYTYDSNRVMSWGDGDTKTKTNYCSRHEIEMHAEQKKREQEQIDKERICSELKVTAAAHAKHLRDLPIEETCVLQLLIEKLGLATTNSRAWRVKQITSNARLCNLFNVRKHKGRWVCDANRVIEANLNLVQRYVGWL